MIVVPQSLRHVAAGPSPEFFQMSNVHISTSLCVVFILHEQITRSAGSIYSRLQSSISGPALTPTSAASPPSIGQYTLWTCPLPGPVTQARLGMINYFRAIRVCIVACQLALFSDATSLSALKGRVMGLEIENEWTMRHLNHLETSQISYSPSP